MSTIVATTQLSDPVTVTDTTRLQALNTKIAVFVGESAPDAADAGIILNPGDTIDIPPGDFRFRSVSGREGRVSYQSWNL